MSEKAKPQAARPRFGSVVDRESSRLTQLLVDSHTQILRGLSLLAPKERRSRVRWIIACGFLVVVGVLAADRSTREFAVSKGRDFYRAHKGGAAPAAAPAPAETTPAVVAAAPVPAPQAPAAAVVASQAAEPATPNEEAAPAVVPPSTRSKRAPKTRGANRPRATAPQGGT
jgi:hypothetical protein